MITTSAYTPEVRYIVVVDVFSPWSVAGELEQLGAPSGVVFPDMMVDGFICLAICIKKK